MGLSRWLGLGLLGLWSPLTLLTPWEHTLAQMLQPIPLECKVGDGAWQTCQMEVKELGRHWFLVIGQQSLEFRHDGTGRVLMDGRGRPVVVAPQWGPDQSLCWGSICARGDLPLD